MVEEKSRVLFICSRNACRSQMAEGILRHLAGERYEVFSAGTEATKVHPLALTVMKEIGIDISSHRSKAIDEFQEKEFDFIITTCDDTLDLCPSFPGRGARIHWSVRNPAAASGSEQEKLRVFREVRRDLVERIEDFIVVDAQARATL